MRLDSDTKLKHMQETFEHFAGQDFVWGESDCCQFVGHYLALCGHNLHEKYGNYKTALGATRAQSKHGTFEETLDAVFETVEVPLAQRTDVVMMETPSGHALGLMSTVGVWAMCEGEGLQLTNCKVLKAWRV